MAKQELITALKILAGSKESFADLLAKTRVNMKLRQAEANRLASSNKSVKMVHKTRKEATSLVGRDMSKKDKWRHTEFIHGIPNNHTEYDTPEKAFDEALKSGYTPKN